MKKEKKVWVLTLLTLWWLSPETTKAQQDSSLDSVRTLDEVIITGTRNEQPVIEVPRSVSVVSRDMIERSVFNSVGELLSSEAGIYVIGATQTPGTNQSIFMRGANSNQVVIMIDGMRVTDPSSPNGSIDFSEMSLTDVERIEIIRGAHSTLYGGAAIGGAINIITRKGRKPGFHGNADVQGGTFGDGALAGNTTISASQRFSSGWFVSGSFFGQQVGGFNAIEDTVTTRFRPADDDDFSKRDYYLKAGYSNERWNVHVAGKRSWQRADIDDGAYDDDDNAVLGMERDFLEYGASGNLSASWTISLTGSHSKSLRSLNNDSSLVSEGVYDRTYYDAAYNGRIDAGELLLKWKKKTLNAMVGSGYYSEAMDFRTFYFSNAFGLPFELVTDYDSIDTSSRTVYGFAHASADFGRFNLQAGTRFNHHSRSGDFFTFELNPSWRFKTSLVYASVSTGFNAPSLYQLFDPTSNADPDISRGNPNLKAERSMSAEIGFKQEYDNGSYFTVSAYTSNISNDIEYVYLWNKETPLDALTFSDYIGDKYINVSKQQVNGIEAGGRLSAGKFHLRGNASLLDGKITVSPADVKADETKGHHVQLYNYGGFLRDDITVGTLARRPRFTGYVEAGYKLTTSLTLLAALRHAGSRDDVEYRAELGPFGALGERTVSAYDLVDVTVSYRVSSAFAIYLKIENITDENYREIYGFQTRGRGGLLKLAFNW